MLSRFDAVIVVGIGDDVICDLCNAEYTTSPETGGILCGSYACCPDCAPEVVANARDLGEEATLRFNSDHVSFADFVRQSRWDVAT